MREQLTASSQPSWRRAARGIYWRFLAITFGYTKIPRSALFNRFMERAPWPYHLFRWQNLEEYGDWLASHAKWRSDPLSGVIDVFPNREVISAQYLAQGCYEDDCDGLAFFSAQNLTWLIDEPYHIYVVTVVLDPYTFSQKPLLYAPHVICVFRHQAVWRVISNTTLYSQTYPTFIEAVQYNPYCASHPVLWAEVRTADLKKLWSGASLEEFVP